MPPPHRRDAPADRSSGTYCHDSRSGDLEPQSHPSCARHVAPTPHDDTTRHGVKATTRNCDPQMAAHLLGQVLMSRPGSDPVSVEAAPVVVDGFNVLNLKYLPEGR